MADGPGGNIERYKKDLDRLVLSGGKLKLALVKEFDMEHRSAETKEKLEGVQLPDFSSEYQIWYSEAQAVVRQLLPDRLADFCSYYELPKGRKDVTVVSYRIADAVRGIAKTNFVTNQRIVGPPDAFPLLTQQVAILQAAARRFTSSLFDIKQTAQAELFDSELDAAKMLVGHGHLRAGGALAGVVLEHHLSQVCKNHTMKIGKKNPTIGDYNDALKNGNAIEQSDWRFNQYLADIRNLCDHKKDRDPTRKQVDELLDGVSKVIKNLY